MAKYPEKLKNINQWSSRVSFMNLTGLWQRNSNSFFFISAARLLSSTISCFSIYFMKQNVSKGFQHSCKDHVLCSSAFPFLKNILHPSFVSTNRDIQSGVLFQDYIHVFSKND